MEAGAKGKMFRLTLVLSALRVTFFLINYIIRKVGTKH